MIGVDDDGLRLRIDPDESVCTELSPLKGWPIARLMPANGDNLKRRVHRPFIGAGSTLASRRHRQTGNKQYGRDRPTRHSQQNRVPTIAFSHKCLETVLLRMDPVKTFTSVFS